jgi:hypothetical protein
MNVILLGNQCFLCFVVKIEAENMYISVICLDILKGKERFHLVLDEI